MIEDRDEFDLKLDRAMASYVEREPLAGLEQRVLARVHAEGNERRAGWWAWATPLAVGGCLLLAFALKTHNLSPGSREAQAARLQPYAEARPIAAIASGGNPAALVSMAPTSPMRRHSTVKIVRQENALPKLDMFPSPLATSETERQLPGLDPEEAAKALVELQQEQDKPIQIAAIYIAPIGQGDDAGRNQQ